jgi:hypothetical protein
MTSQDQADRFFAAVDAVRELPPVRARVVDVSDAALFPEIARAIEHARSLNAEWEER